MFWKWDSETYEFIQKIYFDNSEATMTLFQVISAPMIVAPILLYFLPESPRWLVAKGKTEEAKEVMSK